MILSLNDFAILRILKKYFLLKFCICSSLKMAKFQIYTALCTFKKVCIFIFASFANIAKNNTLPALPILPKIGGSKYE